MSPPPGAYLGVAGHEGQGVAGQHVVVFGVVAQGVGGVRGDLAWGRGERPKGEGEVQAVVVRKHGMNGGEGGEGERGDSPSLRRRSFS